MKLLFDHNLSPRLVRRLADLYPGSIHVFHVNLERASDREVWQFALDNDLTIVSKDSDFGELSEFLGFPPKVVWIRRENCSAREIENLLRNNFEIIERLGGDIESAVLMLF